MHKCRDLTEEMNSKIDSVGFLSKLAVRTPLIEIKISFNLYINNLYIIIYIYK